MTSGSRITSATSNPTFLCLIIRLKLLGLHSLCAPNRSLSSRPALHLNIGFGAPPSSNTLEQSGILIRPWTNYNQANPVEPVLLGLFVPPGLLNWRYDWLYLNRCIGNAVFEAFSLNSCIHWGVITARAGDQSDTPRLKDECLLERCYLSRRHRVGSRTTGASGFI